MSKNSYEAYMVLLRSRDPRPTIEDVRQLVTRAPKASSTSIGYAFSSAALVVSAITVLMSFSSNDATRVDTLLRQPHVASVMNSVCFVKRVRPQHSVVLVPSASAIATIAPNEAESLLTECAARND